MGKHKPEQTRIPMQSVPVYSTNDQLRQNGRLITQNTDCNLINQMHPQYTHAGIRKAGLPPNLTPIPISKHNSVLVRRTGLS